MIFTITPQQLNEMHTMLSDEDKVVFELTGLDVLEYLINMMEVNDTPNIKDYEFSDVIASVNHLDSSADNSVLTIGFDKKASWVCFDKEDIAVMSKEVNKVGE